MMRRERLISLCGIILGAIINLIFFFTIIALLNGWEQIFHDPAISGFLAIVTIFCIAEGHEGARRFEIIACNFENKLDVVLARLTGLIFLSVLVISLCEYLTATTEIDNAIYLAGTITASIGVLLRFFSIRALSEAFVSLPRVRVGQRLVIKGPYSFIRHPSETGLICISLGIGLMMSSLAGLIVAASVLIPITILRVSREERILLKNYKQDYLDYETHVPRFIPI